MNQSNWSNWPYADGHASENIIDPDKTTSYLLNVTFSGALDSALDNVNVIFVGKEGIPVSNEQARVLATARVCDLLPPGARMPSAEIPHDIFFRGHRALLVVQTNEKRMTPSEIRKAGGQVVRALARERFEKAEVHFSGVFAVAGSDGELEALKAFVHGLQTATYALTDFKTEKKEQALKEIVINLGASYIPGSRKAGRFSRMRDEANDIVRAEHMSRRWIDLPAQKNATTVSGMVSAALRVAHPKYRYPQGVLPENVIGGKDLEKAGLNLLWHVGKGRTDDQPALVVLRYNGAGKGKPVIALVGKGIVFDTGGENLKTGDSIDGMHADMAGAAVVLATFDLAVRRKAKVNLIATLALADNSVSGSSQHPRSVLKSYRGKTVEVLNTDAEGRLVLADAVAYTEEHYKPDYLITLATLTGACVVALGNEFAGLFAKTEKIAKAIETASALSWNRVWRMPLSEAVHTKLKPSAIADVANLGPRWGGAITAAKFILEEFAKTEHAAHLDIAGVAANMAGDSAVDATGEKSDFSTGYGPALLWELVNILSKKCKL